jgi:hypothetical protein
MASSGYALIGMCEELFDGTAEHAAHDFDEAYRNAKYVVRQVPIQALRRPERPEPGARRARARTSEHAQGTLK